MRATEDEDGGSPEMAVEPPPLKLSLDDATDNRDNNKPHNNESDTEAPSRFITRPRHQSDAEMRNELEKQRETTRSEKTRSSVTSNRFLAKKAASKAPKVREEHAGDDEHGVDTTLQPHEAQDQDSDDSEATNPTVPSLTAVKKKRSSVATSAAHSGTGDNRAHEDAIVRPQVHLLPTFAMKSSKWTQELQEEEHCGLFVDEKRNHLTRIHTSTLIRLEERLTREQRAANDDDEKLANQSPFPLMDLIHTTTNKPRFDTTQSSVVTYEENFSLAYQDNQVPAKRAANSHTREIAMLEICVDRLILDDYVSFALQDRTSAQLRSLYASYGHVQQQQPWQLHLDRIDAFIDTFCEGGAQQDRELFMTKWEVQTVSDTELALNELTKLQALHQQLLVKWAELQECARSSSFLPYQVKTIQRGDPISLTRVQAFIAILEDRVCDHTIGNQNEEDALVHANVEYFKARVEALQVQDKCLSQVLRLETQHQSPETHGGRNSTVTSLFCSSERVVQHRPHKFYIVIYVNDRQAFATKARSWDEHNQSTTGGHRVPRGLVLFNETFRLKLPFFPESLSAKVFEQGFVFDSAISTTSVPVVLPGQGIRQASAPIPVASLAPSHEWYQFSSTTAISRKHWHSSFLNSSLYVNFTRRPHGRVHIKTTWIPPVYSRENGPSSEGPSQRDTVSCFLPPKRPPLMRALQRNDSAKVIGSRQASSSARHTREELNKSSFSYERDFLVHMKALDSVLDPNDPENAAAVRLQKHLKTQSELMTTRDVFRTSALTFEHSELFSNSAQFASSTSLTKRNMLLQTRDREHSAKFGTSICEAAGCREDAMLSRGGVEPTRWQHAVFEDPMPLEEGEITANERYLALLRPEIKGYDHQLRAENAEEGDLYSIERQRKLNLLRIHDFIDKVKQNQVVTKRKSVAKEKTKTLASIIQEQPLPLFPGTLDLSGLGQIFAPRRRLRPQAAKRSAPSALAEWPTCCDLYIQVQKAFNVPVRMKQRHSPPPASRTKSKTSERKGKKSASKGSDDALEDDDNTEAIGKNKVRVLRQPTSYESQIFVEICFQGKKRKTACSLASTSSANSSNPVWMETLVVPFRPPLDDWSPESIQQCRDEIRINLFDQVVVPGEDDDDRLETMADKNGTGAQLSSFHQENYFLGGLCIPFTTLYHNNGSLEATLRCDMPIEHLGYVNLKSADDSDGSVGIGTPRSSAGDETPRTNPKSPAKRDAMDDKDEGGVKKISREATFLSLMMTLDPLLPLPVKSFEDNVASIGTGDETSEANRRLVQYANDWTLKTQNTNDATRRRNFHVFVRSLNNGNTFLAQYLSAQPPPRSGVFSKSVMTLQKLVRFVKLIPFLDDWYLFDGEKDIWSTSQEFLGINAGDYEEHAVLLCNYLKWLDRDEPNFHNYLVVGHAVPEGDGVYVLRQDAYKIPQRSVLWNASTGVGYHVWDDRCPMRDVSLVVSSDNIYANLQQTPRFRDLNWDIEANSKAWKPFFHATTIQKDKFTLPCVQSRDLKYEETPNDYVNRVEMEIRETLKLEIRRWRSSRFTTTFNIDASMKLRGHLEELERHMQGQQSSEHANDKKAGDTTNVLHELQQTKEISGMPLNLTFTDLDKVVDLNIHWNERANVEFALAVCVCGYPNCVLSVWVYFVSLVPK